MLWSFVQVYIVLKTMTSNPHYVIVSSFTDHTSLHTSNIGALSGKPIILYEFVTLRGKGLLVPDISNRKFSVSW